MRGLNYKITLKNGNILLNLVSMDIDFYTTFFKDNTAEFTKFTHA